MDQRRTGAFIQAARKEMAMTQRDLAEKLGVSDKAVSKWETGNGMPDIAVIPNLCELLGITMNELLAGEKIGIGETEQKAEQNMMSLLMENQKVRKLSVRQIIPGIAMIGISVIFAVLLFFVGNEAGIMRFLDAPTFAIIAVFLAGCSILVSRKTAVIPFLRKLVLPFSGALTLCQIILVLNTAVDAVHLRMNLATAGLSLLYGLIIWVVLFLCETVGEAHRLEERRRPAGR